MFHPAGGNKRMNNVLSVRIDAKTQQMLEEIKAKAAAQEDIMGPIPVKRADIITRCIREYYAKVIDSSASDAYMDLIETTLKAVIEPYYSTQTAAIKRLVREEKKLSEEQHISMLIDRMCFDVQFKAGNLTIDTERLRKLFSADTPYGEVLKEVAEKRLAGEEINQKEDKKDETETQ
jgi:hypothetical protein